MPLSIHKTPKEVLIAARKLIEKPENWTQGVMARNSEGRQVQPASKEACRFCATGAIQREAALFDNFTLNEKAKEFLRNAICQISDNNWEDVEDFNDCSSHYVVIRAFDKAIENADHQVSPPL